MKAERRAPSGSALTLEEQERIRPVQVSPRLAGGAKARTSARLKVRKAILVRRVHKVIPVLKELKDRRVHKGPREHRVRKGRKGLRDHKVRRGHKAPKVLRAHRVLKVRPALQELMLLVQALALAETLFLQPPQVQVE